MLASFCTAGRLRARVPATLSICCSALTQIGSTFWANAVGKLFSAGDCGLVSAGSGGVVVGGSADGSLSPPQALRPSATEAATTATAGSRHAPMGAVYPPPRGLSLRRGRSGDSRDGDLLLAGRLRTGALADVR